MRRIAAAVAVVLGVTSLAACQRERDEKLDVQAAIDRTARQAHRFVYLDTAGQMRTQVTGVVEDDYRYKAGMSINGVTIEEEIVSDDALAVRFLQPDALPKFLAIDPALLAGASDAVPTRSTRPTPEVAIAGLARQRWVLDPAGAPQLAGLADDKRVSGDDPIFDGLTALQYVRDAIGRGQFVKKYSRDAIDPVYRGKDDTFAKPSAGSDLIRYDLKPPKLPRTGDATNQETPETAHFRKLVVYVRDGYVVEVQEEIDVASKLDDIIATFKLGASTTVEQAVAGLNAVRRGQGKDTIRVRTLRLRIVDRGTAQKVDLPSDALPGDLRVLKYRGKQVTPGARVPTA
jgi:hypothetical protein